MKHALLKIHSVLLSALLVAGLVATPVWAGEAPPAESPASSATETAGEEDASLPAEEAPPADEEPSAPEVPPEEAPAEEPAPSETETVPSAPEEDPAEEDEGEPPASEIDLAALTALARQDGAEAARAVNEIENANQHEEAVKAVLDLYYTEDLPAQLAAFTAEADGRAGTWLEAYARAAQERADADLPYEAGQILVQAPAAQEGEASVAAAAEEQDGAVAAQVETPAEGTLTVVELPLWQTVEEAQAEYAAQPGVEAAQPDYYYELVDEPSLWEAQPDGLQTDAIGTNDPYAAQQWYLDRINLGTAWQVAGDLGGTPVRVAVIDAAVDTAHEDLSGAVLHSLARDFSSGVERPLPAGGAEHGTHVAGIIGAVANNGRGIAGVGSGAAAQCVQVMPLNVFGINGKATTAAVVSAMQFAVQNGAGVINLSLGAAVNDPNLASAVAAATAAGTAVVCSAGNAGTDTAYYPADYTDTIAVISLNQVGGRSWFSNYGTKKWISAPGEAILSTVPGNQYALMDGTSMASPIVAGVAALMKYVNPGLSPTQLRDLLGHTATDLGARGFDAQTGWGLVNAAAALEAAAGGYIPLSTVTLNKTTLKINVGKTARLSAALAPTNATFQRVSFFSSNTAVAAVDADGKVTPKKAGKATITAQSGVKTAKCTVTVTANVLSVALNMKAKTLAGPGSRVTLKATLNPKKPKNKKLKWSSSNTAVATVSASGKVTAVGAGKATITAKAHNGKKATCKITVGGTAVKSVKLNKKKLTLRLSPGAKRTATLKATLNPKKPTNKSLTWASSNKKVAKVSSKGKVTAVGKGSCTITVRTADGNKAARVRVTVV